MLRSGSLRETLTLQVKTITKDQYHENSETWSDVTNVCASVQPLAASEQVKADRLETQQRLVITMRYRTGVTVKNRFTHNDCGTIKAYDIVSVNNRDGRNRVLDIVALYEQDNAV